MCGGGAKSVATSISVLMQAWVISLHHSLHGYPQHEYKDPHFLRFEYSQRLFFVFRYYHSVLLMDEAQYLLKAEHIWGILRFYSNHNIIILSFTKLYFISHLHQPSLAFCTGWIGKLHFIILAAIVTNAFAVKSDRRNIAMINTSLTKETLTNFVWTTSLNREIFLTQILTGSWLIPIPFW